MSAYYGVHVEDAGWLISRAGDVAGGFRNVNGSGLFQSNGTNNMLLNQFKIAAARSIRTSTIILATFNTIAAFATAMGILCDSYSRAKRNNRRLKFSQSGFTFVPSGEVYPLVLSFGITIQGTTFAIAQSTGLKNIVTFGCTMVSQLMLPALFLVPYIQLVFAVEFALRGVRKQPFAPRGKWTVTICLTCIGLLTLTNFLVADFIRTLDFCFASLFWFVAKYAAGCFAILVGISLVILICSVVVAARLYKSKKVEVTERVCASRMVYYMALAFISNTFMVPFFFVLAFHDQSDFRNGPQTLNLSMVASVASNVSGLMTGGLYLFLKSNTLSTIGPRSKGGESEREWPKHIIRRPSTNASDINFTSHMMQPVSGPGSLQRMASDASLISSEKENGLEAQGDALPNPLRSHPSLRIPQTPKPAQLFSSGITHVRKRSYSLFPNGSPSKESSATLLPSTTFTPLATARPVRDAQSALNHLKPPPYIRNLAFGRHRRDSSMISSATVQIGLRLSHVEGITSIPMANNPNASVTSLSCPDETKPLGKRPGPLVTTPFPAPHKLDTSVAAVPDASPKRDRVKSARMKTLPPVPNLGQPVPASEDDDDYPSNYEEEEEEAVTLSPTVYNSQSSTKSRDTNSKAVDLTLPSSRFRASNAPISPPRRPPTGHAPTTRADWI